ncbi:MAG: hypothetical protein ACKOHM_12115 [Spartobacteria bacterium]
MRFTICAETLRVIDAAKMKFVRKPARPARINIRITHETIARLRARAEEAGLPYQTLAASVLHMVGKGDLTLSLSRVA